jgi:hypothetical protein
MTQTTSSLVINPTVWGDMAQAVFTGQVRVAGSAAVIQNNNLEGVPGGTINFPKWGAIADLDDLAEGTAMTPAAMATANSTATIKEAGKAVEITDKARLVSLGDPEVEARRQFGILAARKVDADLITQAQANETGQGGGQPYTFTIAAGGGKTKLTWLDYIVPSIGKFGDAWEPSDFAGLYINSAQLGDVFSDTQFINAATLGASGTPVTTGQIGEIAGIPVFVTNRIAAKTYLIMKKGALGLLYKRRPLVESDRDILARSTVVTTTIHYAVKRLDDTAVCVGTIPAT